MEVLVQTQTPDRVLVEKLFPYYIDGGLTLPGEDRVDEGKKT